ncbi:MAG: biotin--[acetyl-CoA-carboxylase] ligase [Brachymonas sp.]|nr:biotin--[acetyl-CoA-carboxylase] ligase [Brachymonas sp.]
MNPCQLDWPASAIAHNLQPFWPGMAVEVLAETASTNTLLMERAREGLLAPMLVVTERQTAGRGRMGRTWHSNQPVGEALTFSIGVPLPPRADLSGLSVVVGCAVAQALDPRDQHGLRVKWPNDLWFAQRKLAGVLVEISTQGGHSYAVIGTGINIAPPPPLPAATQGQAQVLPPAWVQEFAPQVTAPEVLHQIAPPLVHALQQFLHTGFAPWQARFAERDALAGQPVWLSDGSRGVAQGVNAQGALRIHTGAAIREVRSEEVSVRPLRGGNGAVAQSEPMR